MYQVNIIHHEKDTTFQISCCPIDDNEKLWKEWYEKMGYNPKYNVFHGTIEECREFIKNNKQKEHFLPAREK